MDETQNTEPPQPAFLERWAPLICTLAIGLFIGVIAFITSIEGDTFYVKFVFPFTFIFIGVWRSVSVADWDLSRTYPELVDLLALGSLLVVSVAQFIVYGVLLSLASDRPPMIVKIAAVHAGAVILAFAFGYFFRF